MRPLTWTLCLPFLFLQICKSDTYKAHRWKKTTSFQVNQVISSKQNSSAKETDLSFNSKMNRLSNLFLKRDSDTGWRKLIGSPKLQIIFHKRATKYRALLRKMTYKDKGSYGSSPPCNIFDRMFKFGEVGNIWIRSTETKQRQLSIKRNLDSRETALRFSKLPSEKKIGIRARKLILILA